MRDQKEKHTKKLRQKEYEKWILEDKERKKEKATNHNNSTELSSVISREKRNLIYTNYAQFV